MKRLFLLLCLLLSVEVQALARTPLMPVDNLKAGMRGYAKTVISGDTIETFPVEVLGVTGSESMGYQILIRAGGGVMERSGGIAQGMSGSPVYIDGKLAGAIAYGTAFSDPHYCLLTPIQDMLDLLDKPEPHRPDAKASLLPKGTPLLAGGFAPAGIAVLQETLEPMGVTVTDAGASGGVSSHKDLEPGSSVGAALIQGDLTLGALGTVTWTDERGRILAFGHPFMKRGNADFFLTRTWVLASIPNLQTAYKIGTIGAAAGSFNQDRNAGIAGQIGRLPAYIPLYVSVSDSTRSRNGSQHPCPGQEKISIPPFHKGMAEGKDPAPFVRPGHGSQRPQCQIALYQGRSYRTSRFQVLIRGNAAGNPGIGHCHAHRLKSFL